MPKNFVEAGAASSILAIADYAGVGLAETQAELTPLQRMVITMEAERQHEEAEQATQGGASGAGQNTQVMNSKVHSGGGTAGDTVTYINEATE